MIKDMKEAPKNLPYTLLEEIKQRAPFFERLTRNALVGALLLLVVTVTTGGTQAIQASLSQDWDERLGRLTFVSNMFPDAVQVFFPSSKALTAPCFGETTHVYSADEPYLGFLSTDKHVYPARAGEVTSVAHGENEERIVEIAHGGGLSTVYYNLSEVYVLEGQAVNEDDALGTANAGKIYLETRRDGLPFDPTDTLVPRMAQ